MVDWVMVNGARIERTFFEENVSEARRYNWLQTRWGNPNDHAHCMICGVVLSRGDICYRSDGGWVCPHCYENFVSLATGK